MNGWERNMEIIPIMQQYLCVAKNHEMKAVVKHEADQRVVRYFWDQGIVSEKVLPAGSYLTDDECICDMLRDYSIQKSGVFADLLKNHTDIISLVSKQLQVQIKDFGIIFDAKLIIEKDFYNIELATENGDNCFSGRFKAEGFSEVLEKLRIFTSMLGGVSTELANDINLLSSDKIEELVRWKE